VLSGAVLLGFQIALLAQLLSDDIEGVPECGGV
jgi:hypothetical protein